MYFSLPLSWIQIRDFDHVCDPVQRPIVPVSYVVLLVALQMPPVVVSVAELPVGIGLQLAFFFPRPNRVLDLLQTKQQKQRGRGERGRPVVVVLRFAFVEPQLFVVAQQQCAASPPFCGWLLWSPPLGAGGPVVAVQ